MASQPAQNFGSDGFLANSQLLFGIIALQSNFITREQLVAAFDVWVMNKSQSLAEILEQRQALLPDDRTALQTLVDRFLKKHQGDPEKSLAALSPSPELRPDLERLADSDLQASLTFIVPDSRSDDPYQTSPRIDPSTNSHGRFRILRPHAKGGLGQVSVAYDSELHREVALKEIQPKHADHEISRERFVLEAEITGGLEHPGIVPVYALGQDAAGRPYYAMRFIKGDSLKDALEAYHRADNPNRHKLGLRLLELRQLLGRFIDVCQAMEYAHSRGVLHRDLKPGNIMVGKYGETLVVDWGLAKAVGRKEILSEELSLQPASALSSSGQTQPGSAIGTPSYMSPEQAVGQLGDLGPTSDVYSLGATLYHILCGRPPFEKDQLEIILSKVQRGSFPRPRDVVADVPRGLEAICLKAMALLPSQRYPSARALADDLEHWLADEPIAAAPDTLAERASRFARRHRGYVRTGAVAIVLVAVVSLLAAVIINQSRRDAIQSASREADARTRAEKLAEEKNRLAEEKSEVAQAERRAHIAAERQLHIATAERLAALSRLMRPRFPQRSALLAIAAAEATSTFGEPVSPRALEELFDACQSLGGQVLQGGGASLSVFSPDGRWLATVQQGMARLWDLSISDPTIEPAIVPTNGQQLSGLAFSRDSRSLVIGTYDDSAQLWDLTGAPSLDDPVVLSGSRGCFQAFNRIGKSPRWLMTTSVDHVIHLWDLSSPQPAESHIELHGHSAYIEELANTADGHWLVSAAQDHTVRLWNLQSPDPQSSVQVFPLNEQTSGDVVAISPDDRALVINGKFPTLYSLESADPTANPQVLSPQSDSIYAMTVSPDSRWLVTQGAETRVYDLQVADVAASVVVLPNRVVRIQFTPDSKSCVYADGSVIRIRSLPISTATSGATALSGHETQFPDFAISADQQWLVSYDSVSIRRWNLQAPDPATTAQVLGGIEGVISSLTISPDSRWLFTSDSGSIPRLWNLSMPRTAIAPIELGTLPAAAPELVMSPDQRWLACCRPDGRLGLWDLQNDEPQVWSIEETTEGDARLVSETNQPVTSRKEADEPPNVPLAFSSDGRRLVARTAQGLIVHDLQFGKDAWKPLRMPNAGEPEFVVFGGKDRWLVAGSQFYNEQEVLLWNLEATDPAGSMLALVEKSLARVSPGGRWLVTWRSEIVPQRTAPVCRRMTLWDLEKPHPELDPRLLETTDGSITRHVMSRDNRWLAILNQQVRTDQPESGTGKWILDLYDLGGDEPAGRKLTLAVEDLNYDAPMLAISPDSRWLVAGGRTVRIWDLHTPQQAAGVLPIANADRWLVCSMKFSPDSRLLAVGTFDKNVRLFAVMPSQAPQLLSILRSDYLSPRMLFGPQGQRLVMGAGTFLFSDSDFAYSDEPEKSVRLWDLAKPSEPSAMLLDLRFHELSQNLPSHFNNAAFSGDESWLVTIDQSPQRRVHLWDLNAPRLLSRVLREVGRDFTYDELVAFDLAILPRYAPIYVQHGQEALYEGNLVQAIEDFSTVLRSDSTNTGALLGRGEYRIRTGELSNGIADFVAVIRQDPDDARAWYLAVDAELVAGRFDRWRETCRDVLRHFAQINEEGVALRVLYTVLPLDQWQPSTLATLKQLNHVARESLGKERVTGAVRYRLGDYSAALSHFEDSAKIFPLVAWDYLFLAMIQHRLGNPDAARQNLALAAAWTEANPKAAWTEKAEVEQLRREAEQLIHPGTP
ncbi:MAG: protein kinase [Planctomycetes bacterium]|nr:protein kinase [Planctomycetota bacterium]